MKGQAFPNGLASTVAAFEQAALDSQVPATRVAAESVLSSIASRPDVVDVALAVVFQTNSPIARYHACSTLRNAVLDRWDSLSAEARYSPTDALRVRLVSFAVTHPVHSVERTAILYAAAGLTRRAYLEESKESRRQFLSVVCATASQLEGGVDAQPVVTSLEMLALTVVEFGLEASGVDRERLVQARAGFAGPDGEIFDIFRAASRAFHSLVSGSGSVDRSEDVVRVIAHRSLTVIADVLSFRSGDIDNVNAIYCVNRGPEWQELLCELVDLVPCLFRLLDSIRAEGEDSSSDLRSALQEAMTSIVAVSRKSYSSPVVADAVLSAVLRGLEERDISSFSGTSFGEDRLLYGELWRRAAAAHGFEAIFCTAPGILDSFAKNTVEILRATATDGDDAESDLNAECDCMLLDTWVSLTLQAEALGSAAALHSHAASVVAKFIDKSLATLGDGRKSVNVSADEEEDFGFDDESHELAQLDAAAALCRFAPDVTLSRLASLLDDLARRVFLCVRSRPLQDAEIPALHLAQDDLVWVMRLTGMTLADDGAGEQPEVPASFGQSREVSRSLARIFSSLFGTAELETNTTPERSRSIVHGVFGPELSPRVETSILSTLTRVARTYLVPEEVDQERVATMCVGGEDIARSARAMCLRKAVFGICERAFEPEVSDAAAELLLVIAPGRSSGRFAELADDAKWEPLPSCGIEKFKSLEYSTVEKVGTCLSHFYGSVVVDRLIKPATVALHVLSDRKSSIGDSAEQTVVALSFLAGVAQCAQAAPFAHESLIAALRAPNGGACVATRDFARSNIAVPVAVTRFAQDVVSCHMPLLSPAAGLVCFKDCVALISETVKAVLNHASEVADGDVVSIVFVLLSLLQRLSELQRESSASEVAFYGLSLIQPLVTDAVMTYPGVETKYYAVVRMLVCDHSEYVVNLPVDFSAKILHSVQTGCCGNDARGSFEAVESLAKFRARHRELQVPDMPSVSVIDDYLEKFTALILEGIMLGATVFGKAFDAAADALLPLLACGARTAAVFEHVGRSLIQQSGSNEASTVASLAALQAAVQDNGRVQGLVGEKPASAPSEIQRSKKQFRSSVRDLASTARLVMARRAT